MKFIRLGEAKRKRFGDHQTGAIVYEFETGHPHLNFARSDIVGRLPDKGYTKNLTCTMICHVIKGSGRVVIDGQDIRLSTGDTIQIDSGEKYFWEGKPTIIVGITSNPPWTADQYVNCE